MRKFPSRAAIAGGITLALVLAPVAASAAELEAPVEETVAVEETPVVEETVEVTEEVASEEAPVEEVAPEVVVTEEAPADEAPFAPFAAPALVDTTGLTPLGTTGTRQVGPSEFIEYDKWMPVLRQAHISGQALPETGDGIAPDEPVLDVRSLVGNYFGYDDLGALCSIPGLDGWGGENVCTGGGFTPAIDWAEFEWTFNIIGSAGLMNAATVNATGLVAIVPFAENAEYGVEAILTHKETGISTSVRITGFTGENSGHWLESASFLEGIPPMWENYSAAGWRDGRYLAWGNPRETVNPSSELTARSNIPSVQFGTREASGDSSTPVGFGLTSYNGVTQVGVGGVTGPSYRVGALYGEAIDSFSIDLASRIPGVVAVALPDGRDGSLSLAPSPFVTNTPWAGVDYSAGDGLTLTADSSTIRGIFGSAQWTNAVGIVVFAQLASGEVVLVEVRVEALPHDIAGGVVEKRIPVSTELLITDSEMLEASRLSGLEPTVATINALDLPEGVTRVDGGFSYIGSEEPTELAFAFRVAEVYEGEFGAVRPDSNGDGEVRIAVFADTEVPVDPEVPTPETPAPEKPAVVNPPKAGPNATDNRAETGDEQAAAAAEQSVENGRAIGILGAFGAVALALSFLGGWVLGRRKTAPVTANEA